MQSNKDFSEYKDDDLVTREDIAAYLNVNMTTLVGYLNDVYKDVISPVEGNGGRGGKWKYLFSDAKFLAEYMDENPPPKEKKTKTKAHKGYELNAKYSEDLHHAFALTREQLVSQIENLNKQRSDALQSIRGIDDKIKLKQKALEELITVISGHRHIEVAE